jgi:IclR family acetate operon transcriptional repressor
MKKAKKEQPTYAVPAAEQLLDLVEYLSKNPGRWGLTELTRTLGLSQNTTFRILRLLVGRGYAECDEQGRYRLAAGFFSLGMRLGNQFDLRVRARPQLEALAQATGETCQLVVPDRGMLLVLDCITPRADFFLNVVPGSRQFAHASAFGKALLAFLPPVEAAALTASPLAALTEKTITTREALERELALVRTRGLAHDREEYIKGLRCIGAPVFDVQGRAVASVGITGFAGRDDRRSSNPTSSPGGRVNDVGRDDPQCEAGSEGLVLACARAISKDLGFDGAASQKESA